MPIYEYRCHTCQERVEVLVRSSGAEPTCPHCGGLLTNRLLSVPNVLSSRVQRPAGRTCCGREERCAEPACAQEGECRHG